MFQRIIVSRLRPRTKQTEHLVHGVDNDPRWAQLNLVTRLFDDSVRVMQGETRDIRMQSVPDLPWTRSSRSPAGVPATVTLRMCNREHDKRHRAKAVVVGTVVLMVWSPCGTKSTTCSRSGGTSPRAHRRQMKTRASVTTLPPTTNRLTVSP